LRNVELTDHISIRAALTLRQVDFYFRGGDFPVANAENRDPHIVELEEHAFSFGRTTGADLQTPVNHVFSVNPPFTLVGTFADGLPDTAFLYDEYPDSDHLITPEPVFASREAALEDAKNSLVKFLLSLTDPRVKYERALFDRPEIFVPLTVRPRQHLWPSRLFGQYRQWYVQTGSSSRRGGAQALCRLSWGLERLHHW
jgi:hypothetical protein